jgi:hypothetical protein
MVVGVKGGHSSSFGCDECPFFRFLLFLFEPTIVERRTLAALRDALPPRLLSGELRVKMAEKLVDNAAGV